MGFLSGLLETKAASSSVARAMGPSIASVGRPAYTLPGRWAYPRALTEALDKVIWVFRCCDAIAQHQADIPMVVRKTDAKDGEFVETPDITNLLNRRSNPYETAWQFRYRLSIQGLLSPKGVFIEVERGQGGKIVALHLLPAGRTEPIPDAKTFVSGYQVTLANGQIEYLKPEQVIWIRFKPHPDDPFMQLTPLNSLGVAIETDFLARLFNRTFLLNDGRPGTLIALKGNIDPNTAKEVQNRFGGGPQSAGRVTVIGADDMSFTDIGASPRDMQWLEAIRGSKEDILLGFGTPESVLGNASGRTFDNADAEIEIWYTETELPHCNSIGQGLDALTGDLDDDIVIAYDYSNIDVLQRALRRKHDKFLEEFQAGTISLDEYREWTGRETFDVPLSRSIILANGVAVTKDDKDQSALKELTVIGTPPAPDPGQQAADGAQKAIGGLGDTLTNRITALFHQNGGAPAQLTSGQDNGFGSKVLPETETKDAEVVDAEIVPEHPYAQLRTELESSVDSVLTMWGEQQADVIPTRLDHEKSRRGTRHYEYKGLAPELKALDPKYSVDIDRWQADLERSMSAKLRPIIEREAARTADDMMALGITEELHAQGIGSPRASSSLARIVGTKSAGTQLTEKVMRDLQRVITTAARNQSEKVAKKIADLDDSGASMTEIKREVKKLIGARASWRNQLSTYVTTAAVEGVQAAVYSHAGDLVEKTWHTENDERVRPSHAAVDGSTVEGDAQFRVGGSEMSHPGDPKAPIGETAGCRCWASYEPAEGVGDL